MSSKEAVKAVEQLRTDGAKPDLMFKGTYQYVVSVGKMKGAVRSGTVACAAGSIEEARLKMGHLVSNFGHGDARFVSINQWS